MKESNWINDVALEQGLRDYVWRSLKGKEILDFMKRDYEQYCWSIAALDRRLLFFDINYVCTTENKSEITNASWSTGATKSCTQDVTKRILWRTTILPPILKKYGEKKAFPLRRSSWCCIVWRSRETVWVSKLDFVCIHWVWMDVSTLFRERSYFCTSTTRFQILCLLEENI